MAHAIDSAMNNIKFQPNNNGFMLLEFLCLLALFVILVSLTISSWQIQQMRKALKSRAVDNITLWHLREDASRAQEVIFHGRQLDPSSSCTKIPMSEQKLSLFKCKDKQGELELSALMSTR